MSENSTQAAPLHVVVLCHPDDDSFNASVAKAYCAAVHELGHRVIIRNLYGMGFEPVLKGAERPGANYRQFRDVTDELEIISDAAVFVLVYPIWFGTPPAMLKGYVERVLGTGVTPKAVQAQSARGVLAGKRMISFTTSASSELWLDEQGQVNGLKSCFDHYIERAFAMRPSRHVHFGHIVQGMDPHFAEQHLAEVRAQARTIAGELEPSTAG